MTDPISALRETYGAAPDTSTLKGIIEYSKLWLSSHENASSTRLVQAASEMNRKLEQAILDTEQDLAATGETDANLADPVERCIEAYRGIKDILHDLMDLVMRDKRGDVEESVEELQEACDFLKQAKSDLDQWIESPILRCPKCGASEVDPCQSCGLELLFLDPEGSAGESAESHQLPVEYSKVFKLYTQVRDGERSLSALIASLPTIESITSPLAATVQAAQSKNPDSSVLSETLETLRAIQSGIQLIRSTHSSRKMADLQSAWQLIFQNAIRLQTLRLVLLEQLGGEAERAQAAQERASQSQQDSVSFGRED